MAESINMDGNLRIGNSFDASQNEANVNNRSINAVENIFCETSKEDFSSKMQESYKFSEDEAMMVWDILDSPNTDNIDDDYYNSILNMFG